MYPVERTVSETGEPFHKQQLFLLLGVHKGKWSENVLSACILSRILSLGAHPSPEQPAAIPAAHLSLWAWTCVVLPSEWGHYQSGVLSLNATRWTRWSRRCFQPERCWGSACTSHQLTCKGPPGACQDHLFCSLWGAAAGWEQKNIFGFLYNEKPELDYIKSFEVLLNVWLPAQLVESAEKCLCCFSVSLKLIFSIPARSATEGHPISFVPKASCIHRGHARG